MKTTFWGRDGVALAVTEKDFEVRMMDCVSIGAKLYYISAAEVKYPSMERDVTVECFPVPTPPVINIPFGPFPLPVKDQK